MNHKLVTAGLVGAVALGLLSKSSVDTRTAELSPRLQQNSGLRLAEVTRSRFSSEVIACGTVAFDQRDVALVRAPANGFVEQLRLRAARETVHKDQVLADLYVPDWFGGQMAYLAARGLECSGAADLAQGASQRLRRLGMPEDLIRVLEQTGRPQSRVRLTAPISGVVTELTAREGMRVTTGASLFRISGLSAAYVDVEVAERFAPELRAGDTVNAQSATLPDALFGGVVATVVPSGNPGTPTLCVRVALANPNMQLLPGMPMIVRITCTAESDVLLVPTDAVVAIGSRPVVTVYEDDGRFRSVNVEIGSQTGGQTEIRSGLAVGQRVIVFEYLNQVRPPRLRSRRASDASE